MINLFLRAKHWQLFLLIFALPMLLHMVFVGIVMSRAVANDNPAEIFGLFKWFPVLMIVYTFGLFGWLWSVGVGLQKHLPEGVTMKVGRFKIFLGIAMAYIILLSCWMAYFFGYVVDDLIQYQEFGEHQAPPDLSFLKWLTVIFPMHIFSMFAIFYSFYFNAKTFRSIELGRQARSDDYLGQFFLFWFWFVGVWIMQPKINKIVDGTLKRSTERSGTTIRVNSNEPDLLD